jgi:hypothetical protein
MELGQEHGLLPSTVMPGDGPGRAAERLAHARGQVDVTGEAGQQLGTASFTIQ